MGVDIENPYDGVYYVNKIIHFPVQIVVIRELKDGKHSVLKILKSRAEETEIKRFLEEMATLTDQEDKENVSAVLAASIVANRKLFREVTKNMVLDAEARRDIRIILGEEEEFQRLQAELAESQAQIMRERKESQVQIAKLQAEIERLKRGGLK